jgi:hypothetical protein
MREDISPEEWAIWRDDKVTRAFLAVISNHREEAIRALAYGHYTSPTRQNIAVGAINAYTHVLDAKYEQGTD